jgi:hypothetical protein
MPAQQTMGVLSIFHDKTITSFARIHGLSSFVLVHKQHDRIDEQTFLQDIFGAAIAGC